MRTPLVARFLVETAGVFAFAPIFCWAPAPCLPPGRQSTHWNPMGSGIASQATAGPAGQPHQMGLIQGLIVSRSVLEHDFALACSSERRDFVPPKTAG